MLNQPNIRNKPPKGVINHMFFAGTPNVMANMEPEKNSIPRKNK